MYTITQGLLMAEFHKLINSIIQVVCHITHDISEAPPKEVTSLMRFKPLEFIKGASLNCNS